MAPDPRFFGQAMPWALGELARAVGAELGPGADPARVVRGTAPLDAAGPDDLTFLDNRRYRPQLPATRAGAVIVGPRDAPAVPDGTVALITPHPYKAYARAAALLYPAPRPAPGAHPTAVVDAAAAVDPSATIEAHAVVGPGAEIGPGAWVEAGAVIGPGVVLGRGVRVGLGASVSHALVGDHVRLYPGARVGQDGFGFAIDPAGHVPVPQLGRVLIGAGAQIGANTCIDRGAGPDTVIGPGAWIDNLVQIAHNVRVGAGAVIAAQCGISGSSTIGDGAALGGQVGLAGHLTIGAGARVAAQSGVMRDVPPGAEVMGTPALPMKRFMRQVAVLAKLAGGRTA
jgi:UDP-3-O-[3-hydroxymyristoyl] glucosamine N-acyltransferase